MNLFLLLTFIKLTVSLTLPIGLQTFQFYAQSNQSLNIIQLNISTSQTKLYNFEFDLRSPIYFITFDDGWRFLEYFPNDWEIRYGSEDDY